MQAVEDKLTNRVDVGKALELRMKGVTFADIGALQGVSAQAIQQRLERFSQIIEDPESIQCFDANVDRLLSGSMHKLLSAAVDDQKIKKASTYQLAASYGILFDKQRLTRGQSTSNVLYADMATQEQEIEKEIEKLRKSAQIIDSVAESPDPDVNK